MRPATVDESIARQWRRGIGQVDEYVDGRAIDLRERYGSNVGRLDALTGRECVRRTGESGCGGKEQTACRQRGAPNKRHRGDLPDQRELLPNAADNYLEYA